MAYICGDCGEEQHGNNHTCKKCAAPNPRWVDPPTSPAKDLTDGAMPPGPDSHTGGGNDSDSRGETDTDTDTSAYDPRYGPLLTVSTIVIEPYVMIDHTRRNHTNGGYKGYIVDVMDKVSEIVGFRYKLVPIHDGTYGYRKSDGTWNGMIGELVEKRADMAAAPMYVTKHRAEAVDFSHPFINVEATILLRRPRPGHELRIKSAHDLINQSEYIYGTLNTGVIIRALRLSNDSFHRILWQNMRSFRPSVFTKTNEQGIRRVRQEKYAYVLPTVIGDYLKERMPCDLVTVDRFLMERGYGMAVQKGSGLLPKINRALVILDSMGYLDQVYSKWWVKASECNGIKSSKIYSLNKGSTKIFSATLILPLLISLRIT